MQIRWDVFTGAYALFFEPLSYPTCSIPVPQYPQKIFHKAELSLVHPALILRAPSCNLEGAFKFLHFSIPMIKAHSLTMAITCRNHLVYLRVMTSATLCALLFIPSLLESRRFLTKLHLCTKWLPRTTLCFLSCTRGALTNSRPVHHSEHFPHLCEQGIPIRLSLKRGLLSFCHLYRLPLTLLMHVQ